MPKFGTKNAWFMYFWAGIWKQYCHIWNQYPRICLVAKFSKKAKKPKFGTKNAWFMYFWAGIWKQYCHIWNQHPRICLIANLGPNMCYFSIFWATISFIIFWGFSMFYQIFLLPQVTLCAIITYKHRIYELPNNLRLKILEN